MYLYFLDLKVIEILPLSDRNVSVDLIIHSLLSSTWAFIHRSLGATQINRDNYMCRDKRKTFHDEYCSAIGNDSCLVI